MGIISISLNDTMMKELDHVQKTLGFTGRSEIVRTGIRNFLQEEKEKLDIKGKKNALLLSTFFVSAHQMYGSFRFFYHFVSLQNG